MKLATRQPFAAVTAAALFTAAAICTVTLGTRMSARADAGPSPSQLSSDDLKMVMDQMDKMKQMAADPQQASSMTMEMAKMMVMDQMAMKMAADPQAMQATMDTMKDPNLTKIHDDAQKMVDDRDQMQKMQQQIMADPMAMKMVMHHAMAMAMRNAQGMKN